MNNILSNPKTMETFENIEYGVMYSCGKVMSYTQPTWNKVWDYVCGNEFKVNEIVSGVYISDFYSACDKEKLVDLGITHIVTAIAGVEPMYPDLFSYYNIDVCDRKYSDIKVHFGKCSDFINNAIKNGGKVLVHCKCGVSRSATMVAAYLISKQNYTPRQAIDLMKGRRECINPNDGFIKQLVEYENHVTGKEQVCEHNI